MEGFDFTIPDSITRWHLRMRSMEATLLLNKTSPDDPLFQRLQVFIKELEKRYNERCATKAPEEPEPMVLQASISDAVEEARAFTLFRDMVASTQSKDTLGRITDNDLVTCADRAVYAIRAFNKAWSKHTDQ